MEAAESVALQIEDVHVHYGSSHVLQGVDLAVPAGRITAVVGRNGVGKTTLMHAVMGLLPTTQGHAYVEGKDLLLLPPHERKRHGLVLVPQGRRLFPSLSVEEHLHLVPPIQPGPFSPSSVLELFPALQARLTASARTLSGGEQSMLSIARALVTNPEILLMDEPTEGLAPLLVAAICDTILSLREQGLTILLVEQKLAFALSIADRVAVMDRGSIVDVRERALIQDVAELSDLILHGRVRAP